MLWVGKAAAVVKAWSCSKTLKRQSSQLTAPPCYPISWKDSSGLHHWWLWHKEKSLLLFLCSQTSIRPQCCWNYQGFLKKKRLKGKKHNSSIFTSATLGGFVQLMILNWTYFGGFSGHNVHTNLQNLLCEIKHTIRPIFFFANLSRSHLPNRLNYHISLYTVVYGIKFSYDCLVSSARTHLLVWWFYRIPEI